MPAPSTKNGRRSEKNVSKPLRFTTAGIRLDLAEVGIDRRRQRDARTRARTSGPRRPCAFGSRDDTSGLPGFDRLRVHLPDDIRHELEPLRRLRQLRGPSRSPNDETIAARALRDERPRVGFVQARRSARTTAKPNVALSDGWKRSCENGMRNSARQPSASRETATSHTASQPLSSLQSFDQARPP